MLALFVILYGNNKQYSVATHVIVGALKFGVARQRRKPQQEKHAALMSRTAA